MFKSGAFNLNEAIIASMSDASWAGDVEIINDIPLKHKSQKACLIMLTSPEMIAAEVGIFHPIHYSSNLIRRLCRSTIHAEAQAMQAATEEGWSWPLHRSDASDE